MSNPYEPSALPNQSGYNTGKPGAADKKCPGWLTATCIIIAVIAGLGLLGSLFGIVAGIIQQAASPAMDQGMMQADDPQMLMQQKMQEAQAGTMVVSMILNGINLIIAPWLLISSIGVLIRQKWAPGLFRAGLIAGIVNILVSAAVGIWIQMKVYSAMQEAFTQQAEMDPTAQTVFGVAMIVGFVFAGGIALVQIGIYVFALMSLGWEKNKKYLSTFS